MARPSVTCGSDLVYSYTAVAQTVTLTATASESPQSFTWTLLSVPTGSTALTTSRGSFVNGVATTTGSTSSVSFLTDASMEGTYVFRCIATNSYGVSDPALDQHRGQQCVIFKTQKNSLYVPNDYQYNWGTYLNNTLGLIDDAMNPGGDLHVTGALTVDTDIDANAAGSTATFHDVDVEGVLTVDTDIDANTAGATATLHDVDVEGALTVAETVDITGTLTADSAIVANSDLTVTGSTELFDLNLTGTFTINGSAPQFGSTFVIETDTTIPITGSVASSGYNGYSGPGNLYVTGSMVTVTPTTGNASGISAAGSTTTSIVKPVISANWTADNFNGKFLRATSGTGNNLRRVIKDTTTTTVLLVDALTGFVAGDTFIIEQPQYTFTDLTLNRSLCGIYLNNMYIDGTVTASYSNDITFTNCIFVSAAGTDGLTVSQCNKIALLDCSLIDTGGAVAVTSSASKYVQIDGLMMTGQAYLQLNNQNAVDITNMVSDGHHGTSALLTVKGTSEANLYSVIATNCTTTHSGIIALYQNNYVNIASATGSTGNTTYFGVLCDNGGYNTWTTANCTITGSVANTISLDVAAVTYATLTSNGITIGQKNTVVKVD